jgi:hypothetical protein
LKSFTSGTCHNSVQKVMLTTVWDPTEFAVVTALDSGCKFNAGYSLSEVLTPLSEWWRERGGGDFRKLIVHADHARPHNATVSQQFMARNAMAIAANAAYSPDLTPSDFLPIESCERPAHGRVIRGWGARVLGGRGHSRVPRKVDFDEDFSRVNDETRETC